MVGDFPHHLGLPTFRSEAALFSLQNEEPAGVECRAPVMLVCVCAWGRVRGRPMFWLIASRPRVELCLLVIFVNELWAESHVTQYKSCPCGSFGITGSGTVGLVVGSHYTTIFLVSLGNNLEQRRYQRKEPCFQDGFTSSSVEGRKMLGCCGQIARRWHCLAAQVFVLLTKETLWE